MKKLTFNIDFDGTCVTHSYPNLGMDIGAQEVLKKLVDKGHLLILFTMRGDDKSYLNKALEWFRENEIPLYGINTNPQQKHWTSSPKSHADFIIDDTAIGCPLKLDKGISSYPFIDWIRMEELLIQMGLL